MIERGKTPDSFQNYTPRESRLGTFCSLTNAQKDELRGIILTTIASDLASGKDVPTEDKRDTSTFIHEVTGIGQLAISTGLIEMKNEGYLRPGVGKETTLVVDTAEPTSTASEV